MSRLFGPLGPAFGAIVRDEDSSGESCQKAQAQECDGCTLHAESRASTDVPPSDGKPLLALARDKWQRLLLNKDGVGLAPRSWIAAAPGLA